MKKKRTLIALFVILAGFSAILYPALVKAKVGAFVVNHVIIYRGIHNYHEQNNAYPKNLDELNLNNNDFAKRKAVYYRPIDNSGDDFIILRSNVFGCEVVTHKNGEVEATKDGRLMTNTRYREK